MVLLKKFLFCSSQLLKPDPQEAQRRLTPIQFQLWKFLPEKMCHRVLNAIYKLPLTFLVTIELLPSQILFLLVMKFVLYCKINGLERKVKHSYQHHEQASTHIIAYCISTSMKNTCMMAISILCLLCLKECHCDQKFPLQIFLLLLHVLSALTMYPGT